MAIVFGIGTGRCGTLSLSKLLSAQGRGIVSHERHGYLLPWDRSKPPPARLQALLSGYSDVDENSLCGDIAFNYLPYVDDLLRRYPEAKFICLRRDRAETVASHLRLLVKDHRWLRHDGSYWRLTGWDACYPKYNIEDRVEACGRYWDEYYAVAYEYLDRHPDRFLLFDTPDLNDRGKVSQLLDFVGIPKESQVVQEVCVHRTTGKDYIR